MKNIIPAIFIILFISVFGLSQSKIQNASIEDGWKQIKPLKTDKASVNKLLGTPKIDEHGYYGYLTDDAFIRVNYSATPCESSQYGRGEYNVPKDTVLDYTVSIKKTLKLSELDFNREKYKKDTGGDLKTAVHYVNKEDGIVIGVSISQEGTEYVYKIYYRPSKKNIEKFKCQD